jgi:hypothetical protein
MGNAAHTETGFQGRGDIRDWAGRFIAAGSAFI